MKTTFHTLLIVMASMAVLLTAGCTDTSVDPASQVASHTFSVNSWYYSSPSHYAELQVAEITADNLNSAGVMVYYSAGSNVWVSVPYTVYGTVHDYHMGFMYAPGSVKVTWMYDGTGSGDDPNTYYGTTVKCKVVVVPSSVRMANPDVDWSSYEEVRERFDLND